MEYAGCFAPYFSGSARNQICVILELLFVLLHITSICTHVYMHDYGPTFWAIHTYIGYLSHEILISTYLHVPVYIHYRARGGFADDLRYRPKTQDDLFWRTILRPSWVQDDFEIPGTKYKKRYIAATFHPPLSTFYHHIEFYSIIYYLRTYLYTTFFYSHVRDRTHNLRLRLRGTAYEITVELQYTARPTGHKGHN